MFRLKPQIHQFKKIILFRWVSRPTKRRPGSDCSCNRVRREKSRRRTETKRIKKRKNGESANFTRKTRLFSPDASTRRHEENIYLYILREGFCFAVWAALGLTIFDILQCICFLNLETPVWCDAERVAKVALIQQTAHLEILYRCFKVRTSSCRFLFAISIFRGTRALLWNPGKCYDRLCYALRRKVSRLWGHGWILIFGLMLSFYQSMCPGK